MQVFKNICSLSNKKQLRFLKFLRNLNFLEIEHVNKIILFCEKEGEKESVLLYREQLIQCQKQAINLNNDIEKIKSFLN